MCPSCYQEGGSLLHCLSTLTGMNPAVYFCCTVLGVASTRRYLASCPVKPGLSSPDPFRSCQPRLFILLITRGSVYHIHAAKVNLFLLCIFSLICNIPKHSKSYFFTGNQPKSTHLPRSQLSQPAQPESFTVSVRSL